MLRHRLLLFAVCLFGLLLLAPAACVLAQTSDPAQQKRQKESELARVKQEMAQVAAKLEQTRGEKSALQRQLETQAKKLAEAAQAVQESNAAIAANTHKLETLEGEQAALQADLDAHKDTVTKLVRLSYQMQPYSDLRLLLGNIERKDMGRALAYARYFQQDQLQTVAKVITQLDSLARVKADIKQQRETLDTALAQQEARQKTLAAERDAQKQLLAQVTAREDSEDKRLKNLAQNEKDLDYLIAGLQQKIRQLEQERARQAARPAQRPASPKPAPQAPQKPAPSITDIAPSGSFGKLKGRLPWPLKGQHKRGSGGLLIQSGTGAPVHAVADGSVIYADWLRGYGLMLIVNHGDGWMSLYGGNEALNHDVGDTIRAGTTIATSGASISGHTGVYFGLRHQGQPADPLPWLAK